MRVDDHASLGPGTTTGGGVTIGADTVVGAGALVLADVPPAVVAYGHPARVVGPASPGSPTSHWSPPGGRRTGLRA